MIGSIGLDAAFLDHGSPTLNIVGYDLCEGLRRRHGNFVARGNERFVHLGRIYGLANFGIQKGNQFFRRAGRREETIPLAH